MTSFYVTYAFGVFVLLFVITKDTILREKDVIVVFGPYANIKKIFNIQGRLIVLASMGGAPNLYNNTPHRGVSRNEKALIARMSAFCHVVGRY